MLIYSELQCLGLDAELTRIPDGPSLLGTAGWPLVPTSNQFLSQMTYIKYMLLGEQAAREAGILLKYHANHRLVDDMPTAPPIQPGENPQPEAAEPTQTSTEEDEQQEEQKGHDPATAMPADLLANPDSGKRWEGSESPICSPANCAPPPLDFPPAELGPLEPLEGVDKDGPSQDVTEPTSSLPD
jgi:hypothetical protein